MGKVYQPDTIARDPKANHTLFSRHCQRRCSIRIATPSANIIVMAKMTIIKNLLVGERNMWK